MQSPISPDCSVQGADRIAFFQFRKNQDPRRTPGQTMRRVEPGGALPFVTAKNLRVRYNDELGFVTNETARESAKVQLNAGIRIPKAEGIPNPKTRVACARVVGFELRILGFFRISDFGFRIFKTILRPNFVE